MPRWASEDEGAESARRRFPEGTRDFGGVQSGASPLFRRPVLREVVMRTTLHDPAAPDSGAHNSPQRPAVGAAHMPAPLAARHS